jgi:predicted nucleic acid-binding protein
MDLADATLVTLAEQRGFRRIFSLDGDFHIYQTAAGRPLRVLP